MQYDRVLACKLIGEAEVKRLEQEMRQPTVHYRSCSQVSVIKVLKDPWLYHPTTNRYITLESLSLYEAIVFLHSANSLWTLFGNHRCIRKV